jgi:hypothetical protein
MAKIKKGTYKAKEGVENTAAYRKMIGKLRADAAKMAKESDDAERAAYYAIQEIRKNRALRNLK